MAIKNLGKVVPEKGVDYFTEEDINSLNIPTKVSELTNDSQFVGVNYVTSYVANAIKNDSSKGYSTEEQVVGTWIDGKPIYRKCFIHQFNGTYDDTSASGQMISFIRNAVGSSVDSIIRLEARATNPKFDRIGYLGNSFTTIFGSVEYRTSAGSSSSGDLLQIGLVKNNTLYPTITLNLNDSTINIIFEYTKTTD